MGHEPTHYSKINQRIESDYNFINNAHHLVQANTGTITSAFVAIKILGN